MIEETGRVVAVEASAVWVETVRQSTCQSCSARQGCGHSLMERDRAGARARVRAMVDGHRLQPGDQVVVGVPEGALMHGAVMVYLMPLVLLFAGALLGALISGPEQTLAAPFGVAGLLAGFLINRWYSQTRQADTRWQPRVMRVVSGEIMENDRIKKVQLSSPEA